MRTLKFFCCLLLLGICMTGAKDSSPQQDISKAHQAFLQGDFTQATSFYLEAIQAGLDDSASLYYNLGTSFYKNGELGAAMASYLQATALAPNDPDIQYNIMYLLNKIPDKLSYKLPSQEWEAWSAKHWLGERALLGWASSLFAMALLSLSWHVFKTRARPVFLALSMLLALLSLYPFISLIDRLYRTPDWGAVTVAELNVSASPTLKNAVVIFQLHEGSPFAVLEESGDWFKIKLSDAKTGWVLREGVAIFGKKNFIYQSLKSPLSPNKAPI